MSYREFVDRAGNGWTIRTRSRWEWHFEPRKGNPRPTHAAKAPGYQEDPFELSQEELQRLLDSARPLRRPGDRPSPFAD